MMGTENTMERRISDLETKCDTLKRLHDAAADERDALAQQHRSQHDADSAELRQLCADRDAARKERDALRVKHDELLTALHGIGKALGIPECERSPYSVTCGALERVNRLAEIEAQAVSAMTREDAALLCDEVSSDLIAAMLREGRSQDEAKSLTAAARLCASELRAGYAAAPEHKA